MLIICLISMTHPPLGLCESAMCCLWLHARLSSGLCEKQGGPIGSARTICPPIGQSSKVICPTTVSAKLNGGQILIP